MYGAKLKWRAKGKLTKNEDEKEDREEEDLEELLKKWE